MTLTPEDASAGAAYYQQCMQELQQPYPDYTEIQALTHCGSPLRVAAV
jgi:hypothetical protein